MITTRRRGLFVLPFIVLLVVAGCAAETTPPPTPPPSPTPTPTPGLPVTIDLSADNGAFDTDTITVPAGAAVTIAFNNMERDPHNFALYESPEAASAIFIGDIIRGPATIDYDFVAPGTPGTYFFRCDAHPFTMTGSFIVEPGGET